MPYGSSCDGIVIRFWILDWGIWPVVPCSELSQPRPLVFMFDVWLSKIWLESVGTSETMERMPSRVAGIVRGSINITLLLSLLPIIVPISK